MRRCCPVGTTREQVRGRCGGERSWAWALVVGAPRIFCRQASTELAQPLHLLPIPCPATYGFHSFLPRSTPKFRIRKDFSSKPTPTPASHARGDIFQQAANEHPVVSAYSIAISPLLYLCRPQAYPSLILLRYIPSKHQYGPTKRKILR